MMEFKCLTNIETSFRQLRMYAFVFAGICAVVTVTAVWMSYSFARSAPEKPGVPRARTDSSTSAPTGILRM